MDLAVRHYVSMLFMQRLRTAADLTHATAVLQEFWPVEQQAQRTNRPSFHVSPAALQFGWAILDRATAGAGAAGAGAGSEAGESLGLLDSQLPVLECLTGEMPHSWGSYTKDELLNIYMPGVLGGPGMDLFKYGMLLLPGFAERLCLCPVWHDTEAALGPARLPCKMLAAECASRGWMCLLVGPPSSGKTAAMRALAQLSGRPLLELPLTSGTDTSDLLGGFEQMEPERKIQVGDPG